MFPIESDFDKHTWDGMPVRGILPSATLDSAKALSRDHAVFVTIGYNSLRTIRLKRRFQFSFSPRSNLVARRRP
jgi:hypothetical protein